ncbi:MAG: arsenate reductase ArsC [Ilumatobacteraceae bacterium]
MKGVMFLCVHNAGRSQMAAGFMRQLSAGKIGVFSAGSEPGSELNSVVVAAMAEVGVDISAAKPQHWTDDMLDAVDVVVTMGCGDACPIIPGKKYIDWPITDPAGKDIVEVRQIREEIKTRVEDLVAELS